MLAVNYTAHHDWHAAEDAMQDAYAAYFGQAEEKRAAIRDPEGWLIRASLNRASSHRMVERRQHDAEREYAARKGDIIPAEPTGEDFAPTTAPSEQQAKDDATRWTVFLPDGHPAMARYTSLPPRKREVIWLRVVDKLPFGNIARRIMCAEPTARKLYQQGINAIAKVGNIAFNKKSK